ncbi:MAG: ethanolamine utilization protein EutN [Spirochaetales bacterium]|nr:MAG: ethanolamine utilization protein EutN [Spirochaetales bacterium]
MKTGRVIGSVVATRKVESFEGHRLLLLQPTDEAGKASGQPIVAVDICQAGPGDLVLYEGGREAATAMQATFNPSDATIMAIIDDVNVEGGPS